MLIMMMTLPITTRTLLLAIITTATCCCCWVSLQPSTLSVVEAFTTTTTTTASIRTQQQTSSTTPRSSSTGWNKRALILRRRDDHRSLSYQVLDSASLTTRRSSSRLVLRAVTNGDGDDAAATKFDTLLSEGKLNDAVQILRNNNSMESTFFSRERWNRIFDAIELCTMDAEENTENLRQQQPAQLEFPAESRARGEMTNMYNQLRDMNQLQLYGAVDTKDAVPAGGSHTIPPTLLEKIIDLPMAALTPQPTNSVVLAGAVFAVAEIGISTLTGIPFNVLVIATLLAVIVDRLVVNGAIFESILKLFSPGVQTKILRHEAGHFLLAYLLGCPVEGFVLSAWDALQDRRFGTRQVSAGTSFFDPELSEQINTSGKITRSVLDRYSIIVMGGIAAEAIEYGRADGGAGDEMALVGFLSRLNNNSNSKIWDNDNIRNQARWGALQAVLLLREYKEAYDALVTTLESGGSLGDCIYAIESASKEHNLKPLRQPLGYIVNDQQSGGSGEPIWTTTAPVEAARVSAADAVRNTSELNGQRQQPLAVNGDGGGRQQTEKTFDKDESLIKLQEYRDITEKRLRDVERKLNEIEN